MNNYYVYFHINPSTDEIFYVGKGKGSRAYSTYNRNKFWRNIVNKYGYKVSIEHESLSEKEAIDLEISYISKFGRIDIGTGSLVNMTDGGEGSVSRPLSKEAREKIRNARLGTKRSPETCLKIRQAITGLKRTEETLVKMRKPRSEEAKTNMKRSEETRKKISNTIQSKKLLSIR